MIIIGVTGKYCAGKSYISHRIASRGYYEIDVDALGHKALIESYDQLIETFTDVIASPHRKIDRAKLKEIVFSDPAKLLQLESIVHPKMVLMCKELIEKEERKGAKAIIINAALLHRMQLDLICDIICYVHTPLLLRYRRAKVRDKMSWNKFIRVQEAQKDINSTLFDTEGDVYIMKNYGKQSFIHRQVDEFCITIGI